MSDWHILKFIFYGNLYSVCLCIHEYYELTFLPCRIHMFVYEYMQSMYSTFQWHRLRHFSNSPKFTAQKITIQIYWIRDAAENKMSPFQMRLFIFSSWLHTQLLYIIFTSYALCHFLQLNRCASDRVYVWLNIHI